MVEVVSISKKYGTKQALTEMSIEIGPGEVVGLLGLNGAGKSTAMNIMTGYIRPDSGYVRIGGYNISSNPLEAKKRLGYLPEQFSFYNDMKVEEYLNFICDIKRIKQGRNRHVGDLCERAGIAHIRNRMIKNLSKGYRQRVGFVQALLGNPDVVILDEPTVGLDPSQIVDIRTLIKEVGEKRTVIISSHILSEVQLVCSRAVLLHDGKVIANDTPDNLRKSMNEPNKLIVQIEGNPEGVIQALSEQAAFKKITLLAEIESGVNEYRIEGEENSDIRRPLFQTLANAGRIALSIKYGEFTLEDYFIKHVSSQIGGAAITGREETTDASHN